MIQLVYFYEKKKTRTIAGQRCYTLMDDTFEIFVMQHPFIWIILEFVKYPWNIFYNIYNICAYFMNMGRVVYAPFTPYYFTLRKI